MKARRLIKLFEINKKDFINIDQFFVRSLNQGNFYEVEKSMLKYTGASQFKEGDIVCVTDRKKPLYYIYIKYGEYDTPALKTWVEDASGKKLSYFPGTSRGFTPYYIDDFKSR